MANPLTRSSSSSVRRGPAGRAASAGIGGFVERAEGDIDATAVAANVVFHPHAGWVVKLSPGVEFESGDAKPLFRIGAAYDFEVAPDWFLSPEVNVKLVEGEKQVIYGLSIGHDF